MPLSYLRGRLSNALTEAMQPAQDVLCSASFARCCFSRMISVRGGLAGNAFFLSFAHRDPCPANIK